jgi:hypothetical protein
LGRSWNLIEQNFQAKMLTTLDMDGRIDSDAEDDDTVDVYWEAEKYQLVVNDISFTEWDMVAMKLDLQ